MACEPEGRGPKLTCLTTCAKARLPSKPPVFSGGGASSPACGGTEAAALMNGGSLEAPGASLPLALQPARPAGTMPTMTAIRKIILLAEVITEPPRQADALRAS